MQEAIESSDDLPPEAHAILRSLWQHLSSCEAQLAKFDKEIQKRACEDLEARRLTSVPGIDPVAAAAIAALAPDPCHLQEGIVTLQHGLACHHSNDPPEESNGSGEYPRWANGH